MLGGCCALPNIVPRVSAFGGPVSFPVLRNVLHFTPRGCEMEHVVAARELNQHMSAVLGRAVRDVAITTTRDGRPVVHLAPIVPQSSPYLDGLVERDGHGTHGFPLWPLPRATRHPDVSVGSLLVTVD